MCGLTGIYGSRLIPQDRELFSTLLMLNVYRGGDSTGIIRAVGRGDPVSVDMYHSMDPSPSVVYSQDGEDFINNTENTKKKKYPPIHLLAGHTRAATKGVVDLNNCHPFDFDNVVGMHNGTVHTEFPYSKEHGTDSEAIIRNLSEFGVYETVKNINKPGSAYVLVWYDKRDNTLNFVKNSKRPLYFSFLYPQNDTLVWSSTEETLRYALSMHRVQGKGWSKSTNPPVFTLKPHHVLTLEVGPDADESTIVDLEIEEAKNPPATTHTGYGTGYGVGGHTGSYSEWWKEQQPTDKANKVKDKNGQELIKCKDGCYRTREQIEKIRRNAENAAQEKGGSQKTNQYINQAYDDAYGGYAEQFSGQDLSDLPWMEPIETKDVGVGSMPVSEQELRHKLSCGCFNCGFSVDPEDAEERDRVVWWDRDNYACGDCYEGVAGVADMVHGVYDSKVN